MSNSFLSQLNWRFATKEFDPSRFVSESELQKILEAIRLTPTSQGLQLFHVVVVGDQELKKQLAMVARNQEQVSQASHVLVFCNRLDGEARVPNYLQSLREVGVAEERLSKIEASVRASLAKRQGQVYWEWVSRQTYIALGFALAACAELGIDSCPMEGFEPDEVDKVLNLPPHLKSVLLMPIGYRAKEPSRPKVRYSVAEQFTRK